MTLLHKHRGRDRTIPVLNQLFPSIGVADLKVYQIGVGSFGKYGFEKLVELHNEFSPVNVELKGVCDSDFDNLEKAEKFAEANGIDIETFSTVDKMYNTATNEDDQVMIYDAGSADTHADHVYTSMQHGFFHLAEKPPSMSREEHLKEKKLAHKNQAMWKCDFIERENPVVKKTQELLEDQNINKIKVFRQSSVGVQKLLNPVERFGVKGGDILDKMVHEVYILDFIEEAGHSLSLDLKDAETEFFLPKDRGSEKLMTIDGNYTESINYRTATAQTKAVFDADDIEVELHSSWVGLSDETMMEAQKIRGEVDHVVVDRDYSETDEKVFIDEECRFFVVEGDVNLMGDMLHGKLYDLESEQQIPLDYYLHDQLYRVIEKSVLKASGKEAETISEKETDIFMNAVFDVKDAVSNGNFLEEREKVLEKIETMIIEDGKIIENKEAETLAG
jgi:predicted dehydrogenase